MHGFYSRVKNKKHMVPLRFFFCLFLSNLNLDNQNMLISDKGNLIKCKIQV